MENKIKEFVYSRGKFDDLYRAKLDSRYATMKIAMNLFIQRGGKVIVETGTVHGPELWGAGMSTLLFAQLAKEFNVKFYTVDIEPRFITVAKSLTAEYKDYVEYVCMDSLRFLDEFKSEIDLLYLDSWDYPLTPQEGTPEEAHIHQLKEYNMAKDKLHSGSILLLDDNEVLLREPEEHVLVGAKTELSKEAILEDGWELLLDAQQTLFLKERG
jgi:hypothetical protein